MQDLRIFLTRVDDQVPSEQKILLTKRKSNQISRHSSVDSQPLKRKCTLKNFDRPAKIERECCRNISYRETDSEPEENILADSKTKTPISSRKGTKRKYGKRSNRSSNLTAVNEAESLEDIDLYKTLTHNSRAVEYLLESVRRRVPVVIIEKLMLNDENIPVAAKDCWLRLSEESNSEEDTPLIKHCTNPHYIRKTSSQQEDPLLAKQKKMDCPRKVDTPKESESEEDIDSEGHLKKRKKKLTKKIKSPKLSNSDESDSEEESPAKHSEKTLTKPNTKLLKKVTEQNTEKESPNTLVKSLFKSSDEDEPLSKLVNSKKALNFSNTSSSESDFISQLKESSKQKASSKKKYKKGKTICNSENTPDKSCSYEELNNAEDDPESQLKDKSLNASIFQNETLTLDSAEAPKESEEKESLSKSEKNIEPKNAAKFKEGSKASNSSPLIKNWENAKKSLKKPLADVKKKYALAESSDEDEPLKKKDNAPKKDIINILFGNHSESEKSSEEDAGPIDDSLLV